ncbi:274_t:CDS:2 [Acaulospora morrowiae]|uniref:274_t:CDS:1 n=1 Tax=Acaulospora morrowiae TaxID=94023 RepID=A0A9N9DNP3_9GLOM|nr:274_t:CDS:2 [Acaulospora morrowiae]
MSVTGNSTEQTTADSSVSTFVSSAVFNAAVTIGVFITFEIVRKRNKKVYEPRTYLVSERKRSEPLRGGLLGWLWPTLKASNQEVINRIGLDAFMFLRFIRLFAIIYAIFSIIGIGILLPVNYVNQRDLPGLNSFTMGNIKDSYRMYAHVIAAYIFSATTLYFLHRENCTYIRLRHEYFTTPEHRISLRATTILILGIPKNICNEKDLKELFDIFPGGVKRIWINRDPGNIAKLHTAREKLVVNLEASETALIRQYATYLEKQGGKGDVEDGKKVPKALRPVHRKTPLIGSKVDSIETYRNEIQTLNKKIGEKLMDIKDFKQLNSAFIQFNTYVGAQLAANLTIPRLTDISPEDVIWENLNITRSQRLVRYFISFSISSALILLWAFPVAFVSAVSTLSKLKEVIPFLQPLFDKLPSSVVGIIQGILPAVGLSILMMVVNILLVTTFSGGIFNALPPLIKNPTSAVDILAENLPLTSTFFLTYALLSISGSALEILQVGPLIVNILFKMFLVKTPRQVWNLEKTLTSKDWGLSFPPHILMAAIGLVFSSIQPLILPIVTIHFSLYYCSYRYNFIYVYNQLHQSGGLLFPKSVFQFYVGIYIYQLTMIGLMFINTAYIPGVLMTVLFGLTISAVYVMRQNFKHNPHVDFLPVDLMGVIDMNTEQIVGLKNIENLKTGLKTGKVPLKTSEGSTQEYEITDKAEGETDPDAFHITHTQEDEDKSGKAYVHPALVAEQPVVWLPQDSAGVSEEEVNACREEGIKATNQGAILNKKNRVEVDINNIPDGLDFLSVFKIIRDDDFLH